MDIKKFTVTFEDDSTVDFNKTVVAAEVAPEAVAEVAPEVVAETPEVTPEA